ncbi:MAG: dicarboxylate/amino acid:cation symporter [Spirochaetales bacterium]
MSESSKKGMFDWYFKSNLLRRILIGLILGAVVGLVVGPGIGWVKPFGDLFVRLLKMIVVPVIFFSLVGGAASISPARLGKVGVKIVLYYIFTTIIAVTIGLIFANLLKPGIGLNLAGVAGAGKELKQPDLISTLLAIVPTNPIASMANGDVLPIIFFALVFGIGLSYLAESGESRLQEGAKIFLQWIDAGAETMYKVVRGVLQYAPIGVFALIAIVFGTQGAKAFGPLGKVTLAVYLALIVHLVVTYGLILKVNKLGFSKFLKGAKEAMITAFVTRSSSGTLPVTLQCAEDNLGVPRSISSFTLPLGATINMDGTCIYQGICAMFVAFAVGQNLGFSQQLTIIITATLASIGTAGVPGAGAIMLLMVLNSIGMPVKEGTPVAMAYAMILGIDALLDMGRTSLNVTGDMVGTTIVAKSENELDTSKWE